MINPFMWTRRRALMAANKGPTQGLVNGSYYNGQIVVTNNNTITVTSSSSSFWCKIPLISPITPTGSCYSYLMLDNGSSAGSYAKVATYDANNSLITEYGSNPAYWSGRGVYYVAPYISHTAITFKLTVVNNGQTVF